MSIEATQEKPRKGRSKLIITSSNTSEVFEL